MATTASLAWYDFQPSRTVDDGIPDHVRFLRIGFLEYQQLLEANAEAPIEVSNFACFQHPNLRRVQIYLPGVSNIGIWAFGLCKQLEHVEFLMKQPREELEDQQEEENPPPSQLVSIGVFAFHDCVNLPYVTGLEYAAASLQDIGHEAFSGCNSLANVDFLPRLKRLQSLGCKTFSYTKVTNIDLSKAVCLIELQDSTFHDCRALVVIHLPPILRRIGDQAFSGCSVLEQIQLPDGLQRIGNSAFSECSKLKVIVLPSSLQQMGRECFWECDKLMRIVLPSSRVKFLATRPFNRFCKSLSLLELPIPVPCQQWPLILEQFSKEDGIAKRQGSIRNAKNRNTIMWNFLCQNLAQFFITAIMSKQCPLPETQIALQLVGERKCHPPQSIEFRNHKNSSARGTTRVVKFLSG